VFAHWEGVVGPNVAAHAHPLTLRDGVLIVGVDQPAWATELNHLKADLLRRIGEVTGSAEVTEVRVRVSGPRSGQSVRNRPDR
jgi:predicted nucleic acid-binding Zn ribbon protein